MRSSTEPVQTIAAPSPPNTRPGAIVHEWIERSGGAERVLDEFIATFDEADVFALWNDAPERVPGTVQQSWLSRTPLRRHKAAALPIMPAAWRGLRGRGLYKWVLVSSHLFAHHVSFKGQEELPKYVYTHTPARYIWSPELDKRGASITARAASNLLRPLDRKRAKEATAIAANSQFVRARVEDYWQRDASVIYPPVDTQRIKAVADWREELTGNELRLLDSLPSHFILGASRFIPYKRLDRVISAAEESGIPVVLAGNGPLLASLQVQAAAASVPARIIESPTDAMLYALYQRALAFVFPAVEDFGIMPVEAMAAGCPVVSLSTGGASESVIDRRSGSHSESAEPRSLAIAIQTAIDLDRTTISLEVDRFSRQRFRSEIRDWIGGDR